MTPFSGVLWLWGKWIEAQGENVDHNRGHPRDRTAIAASYAREDASLVLVAARGKKELDETAERFRALGILADVSKEEDVAMVVRAALQRHGRIDIPVNNAGRGMK